MTETKTVCAKCGDTGYVPPFMQPCVTCATKPAAVFTGDPETITPGTVLLAALAAPTEVPPMPWLPPHPNVGDKAMHRGGKYVVWTGDKWVDLPTVEVAPGDPFIRPRLDELGDTTELLDAVDDAAEAMGAEWAARYAEEAETDEALLAGLEFPEPDADEFAPVMTTDVIAETTAATTSKAALEAACEAIPAPPATKGVRPMTAAQETLLRRLVAERNPANPTVMSANAMLGGGSVSARQASKLIDGLVAVPADPTKKPDRPNSYDGVCRDCGGMVPATTGVIRQVAGRWVTFHKTGGCLTDEAKKALEAEKVIEPGLYKHAHPFKVDVYRVRHNRGKTRLYGELVVVTVHDEADTKSVEFVYNGKAMAFLRRSDRLTWQEARDFGAAYGACVACGRTLEDARSLVQQYGATCAGHYGWPTVTKSQAEAIIAGVLTWEDVTGLPG